MNITTVVWSLTVTFNKAEILILRKFEYIEFEKCVNDDKDCSFILYTINKYCQFDQKMYLNFLCLHLNTCAPLN
jgi:hypothetical protein